MVNFKSFIFISFGIMFTSCCYKGTINEYNNIRKKMDFTVTTNNGKIYDIIDTTKIYINTGIYSRDTYYKSSESKYVEYLKFYANGRHAIQNQAIHNLNLLGIIDKRQPGFRNQSWDWKPYFQYQSHNPYTLW